MPLEDWNKERKRGKNQGSLAASPARKLVAAP